MLLTSREISQKCFMEVPYGLDPEEVYCFLEVIKEDYAELEKEVAVLRTKLAGTTHD